VKTKIKGLVGLSAFLCAATLGGFFPTDAHALGCSSFFASGPMVCGDSEVAGNSLGPFVVTADPVLTEQSGGPVLVGAVGSGTGGIAATATASGSFGEAHVSASADNGQFNTPAGFGFAAQASGNSIIGVVDGFSITGAALDVRITSSIDGIFTGQQTVGGITFPASGSAGISFVLFQAHNTIPPLSADVGVDSTGPSASFSNDILLQPGDYLFLWTMVASARSVAGVTSVIPSQTADASNTGLLFFDVLTPNASLTFLSGHDYSSSAAVPSATPLPAALPLFATGLGALGLLGWRRKRKFNLAPAS
jgi:hypothetical protein